MKDKDQEKVKGAGGGTSKLLSLVDIQEQYGRHIIDSFAATLNGINKVCDIGCGYGNDLEIIKKYFKHANYYGIDYFTQNKDLLLEKEISLKVCDLEKDELDFEDSSVDLFVANQVFEHLKEIFWVTHQMSKKLKVGGYLIIGVPNIAALHNRILFNFGVQPSQMKSYSAHIRGFGPNEIPKFIDTCFPHGYELKKVAGSQFYPFPKITARILCRFFPRLSHSIFYLFQKKKTYNGEFIKHPDKAKLETNFFTGE